MTEFFQVIPSRQGGQKNSVRGTHFVAAEAYLLTPEIELKWNEKLVFNRRLQFITTGRA